MADQHRGVGDDESIRSDPGTRGCPDGDTRDDGDGRYGARRHSRRAVAQELTPAKLRCATMWRVSDEPGTHAASGTREMLISVDVETSGPSPGTSSLLAIGACLVDDPSQSFYRELQPIPGRGWDADAARVHRLDRDELERHGLAPPTAMAEFAAWIDSQRGDARAIFVGFNAPFDWMFVADYYWRFLGRNPFGHAALDLKSLYMGRDGVSTWAATSKSVVADRYPVDEAHTHQALDDARMQAARARRLLHDPR